MVMKWKNDTFQVESNDSMSNTNKVIHFGYLHKQSLHFKNYRKRWMVLTSDNELLSYKSRSNNLTPTEIIDLSLCKEIKSDQYYEKSIAKFPFTLYFKDNTARSFGSESAEMRDIWIKYLLNIVNIRN